MLSLRARIIRFVSRQYMKRVRPDGDVHRMRRGFETRTAVLKPAPGVDIRRESVAGIDCEIHVPNGAEAAPMIFYLHGGAFLMGSPATHRRLVSFIARAAGMRAILPDYRLAPEHRHPAALEDSLAVYRDLLRGGADPRNMAIGGDSAGGNLAMATLLALRDSGDPLPAATFLMSPWLDLASGGESFTTRAGVDPWFRPEDVPVLVSRVCDPGQMYLPLVSPLRGDPRGLPPTLIQVGDHELLLSDSVNMAERMRSAGVAVDLTVWPELWHVFQFFVGQMPESNAAVANIGAFLTEQFGHATGTDAAVRAA